MTSTIPRSSRPPPPSGPLPALPVYKTRSKSSQSLDRCDDLDDASRRISVASTSMLPTSTPRRTATSASARSVPETGLRTPKTIKASSTPSVPTLHGGTTLSSYSTSSSPALTAVPKTLRKVTSIGAFPLPPKGTSRVSSLPPSPLSTSQSTTPTEPLPPAVPPKSKQRETTKHRSGEGTGRKLKPKGSMQSLRPKASNSNLVGSPSLLNGTGESNLISSGSGGARVSDSLLSIPSPSASRSSSADGSYQTDVTAFEDMGEDHGERGRAKKAHNSVAKRDSGGKDSKGNVLVSVRVRPDASNDESRPEGEWLVDGRRALISYKGREAGDYRYDNVFSPNDSNHRVYDNAAKRLVRRVMEGYHGTVFAYGMTGTGKTFSMQGTANSPGVIPLAITDIFSYIREMPSREFLLRVSYLEIYNEKIYDLLSPAAPGQQQEDIKLREDSKRGVYASPLKEEIVQSPNQLLRVIARGDLARRTGSTQFNARSSRSHAVVQIVVESRERGAAQSEGRRGAQIAPGGVLVSTLSLIDLAGSEKAAESKERRTEGAHINKSLLTLGTVIARLSTEEEGAKDKDKAVKHLPYRDSKLTRLLQGALSGDSLVSILCTIQLSSANTSAALAISHTAETLNTLKFASRAKNNIVSHAKRNESNATPGDPSSRALLDRYKMEIEELRAQLQQQTKDKEIAERREEIEKDRIVEEQLEREEKTRHEEQMLEMQLARTALKERISHLNRLILSSKSIGVNSGRYSSASGMLNQRASAFSAAAQSEYGRPVSIRSRDSVRDSKRDSTVTLEVPMPAERTARAMSSGSIIAGTLPTPQVSHLVMEETSALAGDDDCEDTTGEDGEGNASLAQQNRMLQADLADKNRYIATLEKRLLQARRTSHSRVSMHFAARVGVPEEGSLEALLRDREREVEELRAKLDDQMRMVTALRSAARKREMVDQRTSHQTMGSEETARPATSSGATDIVTDLSSLPFNRTTSSRLSRHSSRSTTATDHNRDTSSTSRSSTGVVNFSKNPLSPVALLSPSHSSNNSRDNIAAGVRHQARIGRRKSVDEMTQLLDEMIQNKIQSGHVVRGDRGSLRVRSDKIQQSITSGVDGCLPEE